MERTVLGLLSGIDLTFAKESLAGSLVYLWVVRPKELIDLFGFPLGSMWIAHWYTKDISALVPYMQDTTIAFSLGMFGLAIVAQTIRAGVPSLPNPFKLGGK